MRREKWDVGREKMQVRLKSHLHVRINHPICQDHKETQNIPTSDD